MYRLDPGYGQVPSIRLRTASHVRDVVEERQTSLLLHHGTWDWADRLAPGFDFFLWTARTAGGDLERIAARVRCLRVCVHRPIYAIRDCRSGHRPDSVRPGRAGWHRIWNAAASFGEPQRPDQERRTEKFRQPWSVVDFEFVGCDNWSRRRNRRYRNETERELARESRAFEAVRLTEGPEREPGDDELRFKAKSAAYNRKLSHALTAGEDTAMLTVTDDEVRAELERRLRRRRPRPAAGR